MVETLSAAQQSALELSTHEKVFAVKIDLATDLLYCSGDTPVTISGDTYYPRGVSVSAFKVAKAKQATATVTLDDMDGVVATAWYTERFTGNTVTVTEAIWGEPGDGWVAIRTIPWICTTCKRTSEGKFIVNLSGAGGLKPRWGLETASRANFHLAPEAGQTLRIGGYTVKVVS
jgi:hypothetical protein